MTSNMTVGTLSLLKGNKLLENPFVEPIVSFLQLIHHIFLEPLPEAAPRPTMVLDALDASNGDDPKTKMIYYLGIGSNMLRSKVEGRCIDGTDIKIISIEPCVIPNHRLALNMSCFPPMEPAMASLEPLQPVDEDDFCSQPLRLYDKAECHAALIQVSVEHYQKIMKSEGVIDNESGPRGAKYEEIVVTAIPYDRSKEPVQAVALRTRPYARLRNDVAPSTRYIGLLRQGASELNLDASYQEFLKNYPCEQDTPMYVMILSVFAMIFTVTCGSVWNMPGVSTIVCWFLYRFYVPSYHASKWRVQLGYLACAGILFPAAIAGWGLKTIYYGLLGARVPKFLAFLMKHFKAHAEYKKE